MVIGSFCKMTFQFWPGIHEFNASSGADSAKQIEPVIFRKVILPVDGREYCIVCIFLVKPTFRSCMFSEGGCGSWKKVRTDAQCKAEGIDSPEDNPVPLKSDKEPDNGGQYEADNHHEQHLPNDLCAQVCDWSIESICSLSVRRLMKGNCQIRDFQNFPLLRKWLTLSNWKCRTTKAAEQSVIGLLFREAH